MLATVPSPKSAVGNRFQIALRVADLPRSLSFYRLLLQREPAALTAQSARFETDAPPLAVTLTQGDVGGHGTLNHLGLRLPDQASLVDLQRRLEEGGIATQRQEGVECCYALQTKFWVTDPDKHLWELYIFHEDLDHSGFDDLTTTQPRKAKAEPKVWTHALTAPLPARIDCADASLDEVHLEGTFNARLDDGEKRSFLAEVQRVLRPGGTVAVHGMAGDRSFPGMPAFPGIAALVQHVPAVSELMELLHAAGFANLFLERCDAICLAMPGIDLREVRLLGTRPAENESGTQGVMYKGPFAEAVDGDGVVFRRGERVAVSTATETNLRQGPAADQFVFLST
jgi:catechol 2,3-dioxygenase-like lactoylglutathione lyase family enzyme